MSQEFITTLFHTIDARDWESLPRFFSDHIVYERPGYEPIRGIEALTEFYRDIRILKAGKHHLEQIVINDDAGACWGRFIGIKRDGSQADERFADVYLFDEDKKILGRKSYFFRPAV